MDQARTVPGDFPTDGVELSCFLVVSNYARALPFYRDVLGATVVRELFPIGLLEVLDVLKIICYLMNRCFIMREKSGRRQKKVGMSRVLFAETPLAASLRSEEGNIPWEKLL